MMGSLDKYYAGEVTEGDVSAPEVDEETVRKATEFRNWVRENPHKAIPMTRGIQVKVPNSRMEGSPSTSDAIQWMGDRMLKGMTGGLYKNPWLTSTQQRKFSELDQRKVTTGPFGLSMSGRTFGEEVGGLLPIGKVGSFFGKMGSKAKRIIQARMEARVAPEVLKAERMAEMARRSSEKALLVSGVGDPKVKALADAAISKAATSGPKQTAAQELAERVIKRTKLSPKTGRPLTRKGKAIQTAEKVETKGHSARATQQRALRYEDLPLRDIFGETSITRPSYEAMQRRLSVREAIHAPMGAVVGALSPRSRPSVLIRPAGIADPAVGYQLSRLLPAIGAGFGAAAGATLPVWAARTREEESLDPNNPVDRALMKYLAERE